MGLRDHDRPLNDRGLDDAPIMAEKLNKASMKCNSARSTPSHPKKSHVVKACSGGIEKIIRFGQQGVKGSPKKAGESEAYANRRKRFFNLGQSSTPDQSSLTSDKIKSTNKNGS